MIVIIDLPKEFTNIGLDVDGGVVFADNNNSSDFKKWRMQLPFKGWEIVRKSGSSVVLMRKSWLLRVLKKITRL